MFITKHNTLQIIQLQDKKKNKFGRNYRYLK